MIARVLKQNPNTWKAKKTAIYYDKARHTIFRVNPLFQATQQHLNNGKTMNNEM